MEFFSGMISEMHALWLKKELCDVCLKVDDIHISAHRLILAALSPYFKAMFCSRLSESHKFNIEIQDLDAQAVKSIVQFAYSGKLDLCEETVQNVMQTAVMMQIETVINLCCAFMKEHLHPDNCLGIRSFALAMGCPDLQQKADKYCEENFWAVSKSEEFLKLDVKQVIGLISRNDLKVSKEEEVCTAVIEWVNFDPGRSGQEVVAIMDHVRLPLVQWDFLTKKLIKEELFQTNEKCKDYLQQARAFQASVFHPDLNSFAYSEALVRSQPRAYFSIIDRLYAVGGESSTHEVLCSLESYNPYTNELLELPPLPEPRRSLGVAVLEKVIYAIGGASGFDGFNTVYTYDIEEGIWQRGASLVQPRRSMAVAVTRGNVIVMGGHGQNSEVLTTVEKFGVEVNSWQMSTEMLAPRSMGAAAVIGMCVYLCGGYDGSHDLASCHVLDTKAWQWSRCADMREARSLLGAAALDGKVYVAGGCSENLCLSSVEMYDPNSDVWTTVSPLPVPCRGLGLTALGSHLFAAGGHTGQGTQGSIYQYEMLTNEWQIAGNMIIKRSRFGFL